MSAPQTSVAQLLVLSTSKASSWKRAEMFSGQRLDRLDWLADRKKKKGKVTVGLEFADQLNCSFRQ